MKAFAAYIITFLFFLSGTFLSLGVHWCGSELHAISFSGEAEKCDHFNRKEVKNTNRSCCGEGEPSVCSMPGNKEEVENLNGCCNDFELKIEPLTEKLFLFSSSVAPNVFIPTFQLEISFSYPFWLIDSYRALFQEFKPPDKTEPLFLLLEVFLI